MTNATSIATPGSPASNLQASPGASQSKLMPRTTIGTKFAIAITGLGLSVFVLMHMLGNLQVFLGREYLNSYAAFLKHNVELLWPARIGLLVFFIAHIALAIRLRLLSTSARPEKYVFGQKHLQSTIASRTMILSGLVLLFFVLYHLAHFTLGWTNPTHAELEEVQSGGSWVYASSAAAQQLSTKDVKIDPANLSQSQYEKFVKDTPENLKRHDVYSMVVHGFRQPLIAIIYILAMVFLALHLSHGVLSTFQTLGINHSRWAQLITAVGLGWAYLVAGLNIAIVILILLGLIPEAPQPIPTHL